VRVGILLGLSTNVKFNLNSLGGVCAWLRSPQLPQLCWLDMTLPGRKPRKLYYSFKGVSGPGWKPQSLRVQEWRTRTRFVLAPTLPEPQAYVSGTYFTWTASICLRHLYIPGIYYPKTSGSGSSSQSRSSQEPIPSVSVKILAVLFVGRIRQGSVETVKSFSIVGKVRIHDRDMHSGTFYFSACQRKH
jgi:hypothetical protein